MLEGKREDIVPNCPQLYMDLIIRCWDQEPGKRPQIGEVVEHIEAIKKAILEQQHIQWTPNHEFTPLLDPNQGICYDIDVLFVHCLLVEEIPYDKLKKVHIIGEGNFGEVYCQSSHMNAFQIFYRFGKLFTVVRKWP